MHLKGEDKIDWARCGKHSYGDFMDNDELKTICNHTFLNKEEEIALGKRVKEGDEEAVSILVRHNLRLVVSIAKRYSTGRFTLSDAINTGTIGLIKAAKNYDWERGTRFATYATWEIRQCLQKAFWSQKSSMIHIPAHISGLERSKRKGEPISPLQEESMKKAHAAQSGIADVYALPAHVQPEQYEHFPAYGADEVNILMTNLSKLSKKDQYLLKARFGIAPFTESVSQSQLAKVEGITPQGIQLRERLALAKLRALMEPTRKQSHEE